MDQNWTYTSDFFKSKQYEVNTRETSVFSIKILETQGVDRAFVSGAFSLRNVAHLDLQMLLEVLSSLSDRNRAGTLHSVQLLSHELDDWRIGIGVPAGAAICLVYTACRAALEPTRPGLHSVKSGSWTYATWSTQHQERLLSLPGLLYTVSRAALRTYRNCSYSIQSSFEPTRPGLQCPERLLKYPTS
jgi:hypothetical protein